MDRLREKTIAAFLVLGLPAGAQSFDGRDVGVWARDKPPEASGSRLALVVGINQYERSEGLPSLRFAEKDAHDVAAALKDCSFTVTVMTPGGNPAPWSAEAILGQVAKVCALADPGDTVLFYFSGHGFSGDDRQSYACAYNTDPGRLAATALYLSEVTRRLKDSKARKRLMIIDACRNIPGKAGETRRLLLEEFKKAEGTGYLFSTAPGFKSYEPTEGQKDSAGRVLENGLFTHFLLRALQGDGDQNRDGFVTFRECAYRVAADLKTWSAGGTALQKPFLLWDGGAADDILLRDLQGAAPAGPARRVLSWADPVPGTAYDDQTGLPKSVVEKKTRIELVLIPVGTYSRGSPENETRRDRDEGPQHQVTISKPFYLGKHEVTQEQWQDLMGANPSSFKGEVNLPVDNISWDSIQPFLSQTGFRLPTEGEWEYACRAGTTTPFHFGATISTDQANYDGNYTYGCGSKGTFRQKTTTVGSFPANAWGLHDMHGNVWEWCLDSYEVKEYERCTSGVVDPQGPANSTLRLCRGGSWVNFPWDCRSAARDWIPPSSVTPVGLRVARTP